ncbi:hypothetical protein EKO04_008158 [Ascochyta lentis]|uniref:DUF7918 domain-containing protein n=1 Tax=Ascochyta lentis TaxID=205686 RepID=A0A8H7MG69_9PLEO|nr:hypothetical protein EKO04_008158 [Ascochyta lentis]
MAVLPSCPSLTVEIIVNGAPLQEYDANEEELALPKGITKYIEAQSGANFAIRFMSLQPLPDLEFSSCIYLDGEGVDGQIFAKGDFALDEHYTTTGRYSTVGHQTVLQEFQFSEIAVVEGNTDSMNKDLLEKLETSGTIMIIFQGIENIRLNRDSQGPKKMPGVDLVPEKALKGQAKTHTATLAEPQETTSISWASADDVAGEPFATFYFKYRSLTALRALGIVPREPTPIPLDERPEDQLSPEELLQLVRRYKERDEAALQIKKENAGKRNRDDSFADDSDATDGFELAGARNKKRHRSRTKDVIVLD